MTLIETAATDCKIVIYQVFPRLFGNINTTNKAWGTIEENGVGKFDDFSIKALEAIKELGVSHLWLTGVLHHALIRDYTQYGINNDDPDIVKGRAGSPFAIKDYYNVNPDLAKNPAHRLEEFEQLIERVHKLDLKIIIDIVPNHVARNYNAISRPENVDDFGSGDDSSVEYSRNNDFYYIPGKHFMVPGWLDGYLPLGGEPNSLADDFFEEYPAKWTGNNIRSHQPHATDWYETIKINFGVKPDGSWDFESLPADYSSRDYKANYNFWQDKDVPNSWTKFREIVLFWLDKGVDGFRYDMAEMIPIPFWSYLNSAIKMKNSEAILIAEISNPDAYRDYIQSAKMDYLYDKVDMYSTLRKIMQGEETTLTIPSILEKHKGVAGNMLHFLENHDEQRIASSGFCINAEKAKPGMLISACISSGPVMIYSGQEVGEAGIGNPGFGSETKTSIFDYWGIPSHQRWMNDGAFDGGKLKPNEAAIRQFYKKLLNFTLRSTALKADYRDLHYFNAENSTGYHRDKLYSFARWDADEKLVCISNFDVHNTYAFRLVLDSELCEIWDLKAESYTLVDQLDPEQVFSMQTIDGRGFIEVEIQALGSFILKLELH